MKTLIEKDKRLFVTKAWLDEDRIRLSDQEGKEWEVDVATGSLATGANGLLQIERPQFKMPAQPAEAELAAAIAQIRAFANDPDLQVNFAGVGASSYAPVATYLLRFNNGLCRVASVNREWYTFDTCNVTPMRDASICHKPSFMDKNVNFLPITFSQEQKEYVCVTEKAK